MGDVPVEVALDLRAQHAEGPLWDATTARLWWVDITGEQVHQPLAGAIFRCRPGVTGQPSPRYADLPAPVTPAST